MFVHLQSRLLPVFSRFAFRSFSTFLQPTLTKQTSSLFTMPPKRTKKVATEVLESKPTKKVASEPVDSKIDSELVEVKTVSESADSKPTKKIASEQVQPKRGKKTASEPIDSIKSEPVDSELIKENAPEEAKTEPTKKSAPKPVETKPTKKTSQPEEKIVPELRQSKRTKKTPTEPIESTNKSAPEPVTLKRPKKAASEPAPSKAAVVKSTSTKKQKTGSSVRITSLNVNGSRAYAKKSDAIKFFTSDLVLNSDIVCIQETKADPSNFPDYLKTIDGFPHFYVSTSERKGHFGVAVLCRHEPKQVEFKDIKDTEGRIIVVHFDNFILVNVYVPNSGMGLKRLSYRMEWDKEFREMLASLKKINPNVIITGDLNCAHKEIDIANPATNVKNAGFTPEERASFTEHLESGFIDSFRHLNPDTTGAYTFWSARSATARPNNVGWRLDYFLISDGMTSSLVKSQIHPEFMGSDHCPISVDLSF